MLGTLVLLALAWLAPAESIRPEAASSTDPRVIEVRMVDKSATKFVFEPARFTVRPGDVVRFIQTGVQPHNVEFKDAPDGAGLDDGLRMGPYLLRKGETYEIRIDDRFAPGEYPFVCTPHQFLGMTGQMVVTGEAPDTPRS